MISLDGSTGRVYEGAVPTLEAEVQREFSRFLEWADEARRMRVRANADIPRDAKKARSFGAEGIGLCRTEHMFFAEERLPVVVADDLRRGRGASAREGASPRRQRQVERAPRGAAHKERAAAHRALVSELARPGAATRRRWPSCCRSSAPTSRACSRPWTASA